MINNKRPMARTSVRTIREQKRPEFKFSVDDVMRRINNLFKNENYILMREAHEECTGLNICFARDIENGKDYIRLENKNNEDVVDAFRYAGVEHFLAGNDIFVDVDWYVKENAAEKQSVENFQIHRSKLLDQTKASASGVIHSKDCQKAAKDMHKAFRM